MARRRQRRREKQVLGCRHCGRIFEGRANALHCSERCRQSAWRDKRVGEVQAGRQALVDRADRDRRLQSLVATMAREVGLKVEDLG